MHQLLHLLVVDPDGRAAAVQIFERKWVLPIVSCPERTRAIPAIARWIEQCGIQTDVIGLWLGRVAPDASSIDWLVVVRANHYGSRVSSPERCWTTLESLRSSPSMLEYQQWAVANAIGDAGVPSVPGPFGAITWCDEVKAWIAEVTGAPVAGPIRVYRAGPYEVVMAVSTGSGPLYFKGLSSDRGSEALLTSKLSTVSPQTFAPTRALAAKPDGSIWWLTEECAGAALSHALTMAHAEQVVVACARIQKCIMAISDFESVLPRLDVRSAETWSLGLLECNGEIVNAMNAREAIARAFDQVNDAAVPDGWIPMDLDPANVFIDRDEAVRFIDLDDSFLGPAPLAVTTFAQRVKRLRALQTVEPISTGALYRTYERTWPLSQLDAQEWLAYEVVSSVVDAHLGWLRVVRNSAHGQLHGSLDTIAARIAQRLIQVVLPAERRTHPPQM